MVLLGVIVLGAVSFHLSSERFLGSSEKKTQVLNDLTFALQHIHKNVLQATGHVANPGIAFLGIRSIQIRQDLALNGTPLLTPGDYTDDRVVWYFFGPAANPEQITYIPVSGGVLGPTTVLSNSFIDLGFNLALNVADGGVAVTNLALRLDPTLPEDSRTNPQVSTIDAAGQPTVYFYSLTHTWN